MIIPIYMVATHLVDNQLPKVIKGVRFQNGIQSTDAEPTPQPNYYYHFKSSIARFKFWYLTFCTIQNRCCMMRNLIIGYRIGKLWIY